jgi:hypothetical protein
MGAMATCAYLPCSETFEPQRRNQRFCLKGTGRESCRYKYHHARRRNDPHACPWCSVWHDPEERAILDALELLVRDSAYHPIDSEGPLCVDVEDLQALIARRRAIISTETQPAALPLALSEETQMS